VALDLDSADAPQIVWYYSNAPSTATVVLQVDTVRSIVQKQIEIFDFRWGNAPPSFSADAFYREITLDGALAAESPATCSVGRQTSTPASRG
jgi:hypothetical protein